MAGKSVCCRSGQASRIVSLRVSFRLAIRVGAGSEWIDQQLQQGLFSLGAEALEADRHAALVLPWRRCVAAEDAVPERQVEAVVAVGFRSPCGMMDAVHRWRDDQPAQAPVQRRRKAEVGMGEQRTGREQDLE